MSFVWLVECKTCTLRFAVERRELTDGKSTDALPDHQEARSFECPHCHEFHRYTPADYIPGEGRLHAR